MMETLIFFIHCCFQLFDWRSDYVRLDVQTGLWECSTNWLCHEDPLQEIQNSEFIFLKSFSPLPKKNCIITAVSLASIFLQVGSDSTLGQVSLLLETENFIIVTKKSSE